MLPRSEIKKTIRSRVCNCIINLNLVNYAMSGISENNSPSSYILYSNISYYILSFKKIMYISFHFTQDADVIILSETWHILNSVEI